MSNDETRARQLLEFSLMAKDEEWLAKIVDAFGEVRREEREAWSEKLRSALAHFNTSHQMHWDREGTHGANCPACKVDRETRDMLRAALLVPPPPLKGPTE